MTLITPFVSLNLSYCFMKKHLVYKGYVIFTLPKQLLFSYWCEIVLYSFLYFCSVALIICLSLSFKICLCLIWHSIISFLIYFKNIMLYLRHILWQTQKRRRSMAGTCHSEYRYLTT